MSERRIPGLAGRLGRLCGVRRGRIARDPRESSPVGVSDRTLLE